MHNDAEKQIGVLLEEYKEMRNEIRASYGQYFSVLFGIILTGIGASFYNAFQKGWLFVLIPYMILAWINIITFIRSNIQHISRYIVHIEKGLNKSSGKDILSYESEHAKKLWFSKLLFLLGLITCLPLLAIFSISLDRGFQYLKRTELNIFGLQISHVAYLYLPVTIFLALITVVLFIKLPKKYSREN